MPWQVCVKSPPGWVWGQGRRHVRVKGLEERLQHVGCMGCRGLGLDSRFFRFLWKRCFTPSGCLSVTWGQGFESGVGRCHMANCCVSSHSSLTPALRSGRPCRPHGQTRTEDSLLPLSRWPRARGLGASGRDPALISIRASAPPLAKGTAAGGACLQKGGPPLAAGRVEPGCARGRVRGGTLVSPGLQAATADV